MLDLKNRLRQYIPSLFEILNDDRISWKDISNKFQKTYDARLALYNKNGSLRVTASFYDVITERQNGTTGAIHLLDYFDKLFREISDRLDNIQKQQLKSTVYNLLTSVGSDYLHYIGELLLAILNQLIKSEHYIFRQTEFNLGNGNSADFYFNEMKTVKEVLIEVLNIVLKQEIKDDDRQIRDFLDYRFKQKINRKTKGRTDLRSFQLMPVIWGPSKDLRRLAEFYKNGNTVDIINCTSASAYSTFLVDDGSYFHRFGSLASLFNFSTSI